MLKINQNVPFKKSRVIRIGFKKQASTLLKQNTSLNLSVQRWTVNRRIEKKLCELFIEEKVFLNLFMRLSWSWCQNQRTLVWWNKWLTNILHWCGCKNPYASKWRFKGWSTNSSILRGQRPSTFTDKIYYGPVSVWKIVLFYCKDLFYLFVYEYEVSVWVPTAAEHTRGPLIPGDWSYRHLWAATWVLGPNPGSLEEQLLRHFSSPSLTFWTLFKSVKSKVSSETQGDLLIVTACKLKKKKKQSTYFQHIFPQNTRYQSTSNDWDIMREYQTKTQLKPIRTNPKSWSFISIVWNFSCKELEMAS